MFDYVLVRSKKSKRKSRPSTSSLNLECLESRCLLASWQPVGPAPIINGLVEKASPNNEVSGAIHTVIAHPSDSRVLYVGGVNGGIWKTESATSTRPVWEALIDDQPSLSVSTIAMDPDDPDRLVAGYGSMSSFSDGGSLPGLLLSEDGGDNWTLIDHPLLAGKNISGLAINGDRIIAAAGSGFFVNDPIPAGGIFISEDKGVTWTSIEIFQRDPLNPDDPIPYETFDMVHDPTDPDRFYASVARNGIYRTDDGGQNWENVTAFNLRFNDILTFVNSQGLFENNMEMAVGSDGRIYATLISLGQLIYIGYSDDQGSSWTEMDVPMTDEVGGALGLVPKIKPGGQGAIHFSIIVDPNDPKTVYVGGDRQDGDLSLEFGNTIGARNFTGRLFRGDTRQVTIGNMFDPFVANPLVPAPFSSAGQGPNIPFQGYSAQWEHLTHSNLAVNMPEGGTRRGSAPHADSREMAFDAIGNLIQVDDGGIYKRTRPQDNQGDWYSINGNLQVTEFHDIAYDSNSNIIIGGTQDNGTVQQISSNSLVWETTPTILEQTIDAVGVVRNEQGDGGDVAVDDTSLPGFSIRYVSAPGGVGVIPLVRQIYDSQNRMVQEELIPLVVDGSFVSPIAINKIDPERLIVVGTNTVNESTDRGASFSPVSGPNQTNFGVVDRQNAVSYGGVRNGVANPHVLYVGTDGEVLVRKFQDEELRLTRAQFPGGAVRDIVLDPHDWAKAYVVDRDNIFLTRNAGDSWINVTGNLGSQGAGELRSLEFVQARGTGQIVLGTNQGVFVASSNAPQQWREVGDLPNAPVYDLDYDSRDDVLVAGTLGRGAFVLENVSTQLSSGSTGNGGANNRVTGIKWMDQNGNGIRDNGERGISDVWVYVDLNGDNGISIGEPQVKTDQAGRFSIPNIPNGTFAVREITPISHVQTFPSNVQGEHVISFSNGAVENVAFGNRFVGYDFGDPGPLSATRHGWLPRFHLGANNDAEFAPRQGGDNFDDGIQFASDLFPGGTVAVTIQVTNETKAAGFAQGWIDFNADGAFTADERILKTIGDQRFDRSMSKTLSFTVPTSAAVATNIDARFRLSYEHEGNALNATEPAIAGEVEDYKINIVSSGPTANNDFYEVRENSDAEILRVTVNDEIRADASVRIDSVTQPTGGGSVSITLDGQSISYAPRADFSGVETFEYRVTDRSGLSDRATVAVDVIPNYLRISLSAVSTGGSPINSLTVGDEFILQGYVEDLRNVNPTGVFAAYLDVDYMSSLASITGAISYGSDYPNQRSGDIAVDGLIDEVGAFADQDRLGSGPKKLFSVAMTADAAGTLRLGASPADVSPKHDVHLFDKDDAVPDNRIEYRGTEIVISTTRNNNNNNNNVSTNTNPKNPLDVNDDNSVSPIDALMIINDLNEGLSISSTGFTDTNADGHLTPSDALRVINFLNRRARANRVAAVAAAVDLPLQRALPEVPIGGEIRLSDEQVQRRNLDVIQAREAIFSDLEQEVLRRKLAGASLDAF